MTRECGACGWLALDDVARTKWKLVEGLRHVYACPECGTLKLDEHIAVGDGSETSFELDDLRQR